MSNSENEIEQLRNDVEVLNGTIESLRGTVMYLESQTQVMSSILHSNEEEISIVDGRLSNVHDYLNGKIEDQLKGDK